MGRFKSNVLAQRHSHRPPRESRDLDERLSGSLAAFKFANSAGFEKMRSDSFWKAFAPRPILLFQKMRGWLRAGTATRPCAATSRRDVPPWRLPRLQRDSRERPRSPLA